MQCNVLTFMKYSIKKSFLLFCIILLAYQISFADSPLTSTKFYKAYLDVPIVKNASENPKKLSEEAKAYLFDESNPLDVKIALINAVGWDIEGLPTYSEYIEYCFGHYPREKYNIPEDKRLTVEDIYNTVSCEQMAVLVYLHAMADYNDTKSNYSFMEYAMQTPINKQSFMLPMGLIVAQTALDLDDWENIYPAMNYYVNSPEIKDMRSEAIIIVMDYINEYKQYAKE